MRPFLLGWTIDWQAQIINNNYQLRLFYPLVTLVFFLLHHAPLSRLMVSLIHLCVWLLLGGVAVLFDTLVNNFFFRAYHFSPNALFSPQTIRAESTVGALHVFEYLRGSCSITSNLVRGRRDERCFWMLAADKKVFVCICCWWWWWVSVGFAFTQCRTHTNEQKNCNMQHAYEQTNSE